MSEGGAIPFSSPRPIALSGFMGAGKSTVGRRLARSVGRMFVDLDAEIEAAFARSVAEVFREVGEPAFREMEARLMRQALCRPDRVVALGGGAVIDSANRAYLKEHAHWVHLDLPFAELKRRVQAEDIDRPLWTDPAVARALWEEREPQYQEAPYRIDGDQLTGDVAAALAAMGLHLDRGGPGPVTAPERLRVDSPSGAYEVVIGCGMMDELGAAVGAIGSGPIGLLTDQTVGPLHSGSVQSALRASGREVHCLTLPTGEGRKGIAPVLEAVDRLLDVPWSRQAPVVALGGGVLGDMAGLAASLCLRGVPFVPIPTTLLSMVDSSVGGKVGVNHRSGKNRIGAFCHPALVWVDLAFLDTLPDREYRAGLAEIAKAGLLGARGVLQVLEERPDEVLSRAPELLGLLVGASIEAKATIVAKDPEEAGLRRVLNFGHTVGHAIEAAGGFGRLLHGEAVAVGLVAAATLGAKWGHSPEDLSGRVRRLVGQLGLPDSVRGLERSDLLRALKADKKVVGTRLSWVLLGADGEAQLVDRPLDEAAAWLTVLEAEGVLPGLGAG